MAAEKHSEKTKGKLYMLPSPIVEHQLGTISQETIDAIKSLDYFVVERARTSRRFIKEIGHPKQISDLHIFELDKNNADHTTKELHDFLSVLKKGTSIGVLSEAGCPGIADPGNLAVQYAHQNNIQVVPTTGPSSIMLSLMASGLNGQNFTFHGYLPNKANLLTKRLKQLERDILSQKQTQLFIEAPYRNGFILDHIMKTISPNVLLCIACDISAPSQYIVTKPIKGWKGTDWKFLHKRPCVFLLGK